LETTAANSIYALSEVEKTRGSVDGFSLEFRIIMAIRLRETALPDKTRSV
jgi:hypothetical protein